jgi:hypothetical protein
MWQLGSLNIPTCTREFYSSCGQFMPNFARVVLGVLLPYAWRCTHLPWHFELTTTDKTAGTYCS